MKRGVAVVSLAGAAVLGWPSTRVCADSEGTTARLAWVRVPGAESCASVADLQRDVSARLGRDAFAEPAARTIEGTARRQGQRWTADLYIRALDGTLLGSRELTSEASDCMALSGAVALAIALAIDPDAALAPPAPSAAAGSSSSSSSSPSSPSSVSGPPQPPGAKRRGVAGWSPALVVVVPQHDPEAGTTVAARMILTSGLVPRTAVGASLAVDPDALRAFHPSFGALLVPNTRAVDGLTSYGLTAAWAGACGRLGGDAAVHAGACVNALIGVVHAIVHAAEPIDPGDRLWVAASAQGRFGARIVGPFRFDAGLEVLFPLRHQAFRVGGAADDLAFQQRILALAAWIGLAWSFQ